MRPLFHNRAVLEDGDHVRILDRRHTMRHHDDGAILHHSIKGLLDYMLGFRSKALVASSSNKSLGSLMIVRAMAMCYF